jgi:hypothetical protein
VVEQCRPSGSLRTRPHPPSRRIERRFMPVINTMAGASPLAPGRDGCRDVAATTGVARVGRRSAASRGLAFRWEQSAASR